MPQVKRLGVGFAHVLSSPPKTSLSDLDRDPCDGEYQFSWSRGPPTLETGGRRGVGGRLHSSCPSPTQESVLPDTFSLTSRPPTSPPCPSSDGTRNRTINNVQSSPYGTTTRIRVCLSSNGGSVLGRNGVSYCKTCLSSHLPVRGKENYN